MRPGLQQPAVAAVTDLLTRIRQGDAVAKDELLTAVYEELRRLADRFLSGRESHDTLEPTALVHEVYLRMAGKLDARWENRAHYFGAAARAIRRILIDRARARRRDRRGGGQPALPLEAADDVSVHEPQVDLLGLHEALERLTRLDAQKARIVELRFFGCLTAEETAEALGISPSTVAREWRFARIWLHRELSGADER